MANHSRIASTTKGRDFGRTGITTQGSNTKLERLHALVQLYEVRGIFQAQGPQPGNPSPDITAREQPIPTLNALHLVNDRLQLSLRKFSFTKIDKRQTRCTKPFAKASPAAIRTLPGRAVLNWVRKPESLVQVVRKRRYTSAWVTGG